MAYIGNTAPLGANGVYTSPVINTDRADNIVGIVFSNVAGTLAIQQSADGVNWDLSEDVAVAGGAGVGFSKPIYGSQIRLRYTNGAGAQGSFRLHARFSSAGDS